MKKRVITIAVSIAISAIIANCNFSFAEIGDPTNSTKTYQVNGKQYTEELVTVPSTNDNTELNPQELEHSKVVKDRNKITRILEKYTDVFGGIYTDENENNIILLTHPSSELENTIKQQSDFPGKLKISYVKYSKTQLKSKKEELYQRIKELGIKAVGYNSVTNKVNIYITSDSYYNHKDKILSVINEDMINWVISDQVQMEDLSSTHMYPGEQIEDSGIPGTGDTCTLGFNAKVSTYSVGVTAGHCGPNGGIWFDQSGGFNNDIGVMTNSHSAVTENFDAGYIKYKSTMNPTDVTLNSSTLTIGAVDWYEDNYSSMDTLWLHATSTGGTSVGPLHIFDESYSDSVVGQDRLLTTDNPGTVGGDSGGLLYELTNNGTKNYAEIEGILKGRVTFTGTTTTKYLVFSKIDNVYYGVGLSSIYVDSSY